MTKISPGGPTLMLGPPRVEQSRLRPSRDPGSQAVRADKDAKRSAWEDCGASMLGYTAALTRGHYGAVSPLPDGYLFHPRAVGVAAVTTAALKAAFSALRNLRRVQAGELSGAAAVGHTVRDSAIQGASMWAGLTLANIAGSVVPGSSALRSIAIILGSGFAMGPVEKAAKRLLGE